MQLVIAFYFIFLIFFINIFGIEKYWKFQNICHNDIIDKRSISTKYVSGLYPMWLVSSHYSLLRTFSTLFLSFTSKPMKDCLCEEYHKGHIKYMFNDPDLNQQWYYVGTQKSMRNPSHLLSKIWSSGVTGGGIVVAIIGSGLEFDHIDLRANYKAELSYNFISNSSFIRNSSSLLSTMSAGLISAVSNNNICGVGASPSSKFSCLQIFDESNVYNDNIFARALSYKKNLIHIYLVNWILNFTTEPMFTIEGNIIRALENGLKFGRNGYGNLFITGSGDFRSKGSNCAFNGFHQRPEVMVFGAVSSFGKVPRYLERCSAIIAASLSNSGLIHESGLYTTALNNSCLKYAKGSFASASITSGLLSLLLSNDKFLTVRQIRFLIMSTSYQYDSTAIRNNAGFFYSYSIGFGLIDIKKMIMSSQEDYIRNIKEEHICMTRIFRGNRKILKRKSNILFLYTSGCLSSSTCVTTIEQVYIILSLNTFSRNSVRMYLISPKKTRLKILDSRPFDNSKLGFDEWRIKVMGFFMENPLGVWILDIKTRNSVSFLTRVEVEFYGTCESASENINYHTKVVNYLKEKSPDNRSDYFITPCSSILREFTISYRRDICSFTDKDFSEINQLNYLV